VSAFLAKPPVGPRLNYADPLARGLAAAWLFNERGGTRIKNQAVLGYAGSDAGRYDGTVAGSDLQWGSALDGPILRPGSGTQSMTFGTITSGTTFSIAFRMRRTTTGAAYQTLLTESSNQGLWLRSGGLFTYYFGGDHTLGPTLAVGTLYDVVVSCNAGAMTMYVDGTPDAATVASVPSIGWTHSLNDPGGDSFVGDLHHLQVWVGRALTWQDANALRADPYRAFRFRRLPVPLHSSAATAYALAADAGSYTLTGSAAALKAARLLTAAAGAYTLTGSAATVRVARLLSAAAGAYVVTGQAAGLYKGRTLTAGAGSYGLSGGAAALKVARKIVANAGTYALTGSDATLIYTIVSTSGRVYILPATGRTFVLPDSDRSFP
jgi:hypothetical protein